MFNGLLHAARLEKQFALELGILLLETLGECVGDDDFIGETIKSVRGYRFDYVGDELEWLCGRHSVFFNGARFPEKERVVN